MSTAACMSPFSGIARSMTSTRFVVGRSRRNTLSEPRPVAGRQDEVLAALAGIGPGKPEVHHVALVQVVDHAHQRARRHLDTIGPSVRSTFTPA